MIAAIRTSLSIYNLAIVDECLEAYFETKRNFYLGGLRLTEVEGGRFSEAVFRLLQQCTTGTFTPLSTRLNTEKIIKDLGNLPQSSHPDSIRLHIPRALRVIYDIRNNRDAAHLADGIDPNIQDATLVVSLMDWVLAELVRLHHGTSANEAQEIVESLVTRRVPVIQEFDGFLKVLNATLAASDYVLLLLYQRGGAGASGAELSAWVKPEMRSNLRRTLNRLINELAFVHSGDRVTYFITQAGMRNVEVRKLFEMV